MAKAELKTKPNALSVAKFLSKVSPEKKREDCRRILRLMKEATGSQPKMWGTSIVGFGSYHYKYASGREGAWFLTGFSPRKQNIVLYVMPGFAERAKLMARLGKCSTGSSCVYLNGLDQIEMPVLKELLKKSVAALRRRKA